MNLEKINILDEIKIIKDRTINNKKKYNDFLNKFILIDTNKITINNWIILQIWNLEKFINSLDLPNYTYWLSGVSSWKEIFNISKKYTEEEILSITTGYYNINYIYIIFSDMETKIKNYYQILTQLRNFLYLKGINTKIITRNIDYNEINNTYSFNYDEFKDYEKKETIFNLKLIFEDTYNIEGGARIKKNKNRDKKLLLNEFLKIIRDNPSSKELFKDLDIYDFFKNKIIFEINFVYYKQNSNFNLNELNLFNDNYINRSLDFYNGNNIVIIKSKLQKLNKIGMLTFSYLTSSNKVQELGLNVDEYRQKIYIEKELKNNNSLIIKEFTKLKNIYQSIYQHTTNYNYFFIKKIMNIIDKYSIPNYEIFIDFMEKFFMYIFRPAINSFIKYINIELMEKFGILLFIAGGDAMRRYDFNISATKDIDTKLYIGSVLEYKEEIKEVIAHHIVKLRNYLEDNYKSLLQIKTLEINSQGDKIEKILDYSNESISFKYNTDICTVNLSLSEQREKYNQKFRVREIKKSENFPVNLYSIDFRTHFNINNENENILNIALLDIVLQDDILKDYYYNITNDIAYASIKFLIEDLENTYTHDDRALGRISNGKFKKDIIRYNKLYNLFEKADKSSSRSSRSSTKISKKNKENLLKFNEDIDELIEDIEIKKKFYIFIYKLENNYSFNIFDFILTSQLLPIMQNLCNTNDIFNTKYNFLLKIISDISTFNINLLNEDLNKQISNYNKAPKNNYINKHYLNLFLNIIKSNNTIQKNIISHKNKDIIKEIKDRLLKNKNSSSFSKKKIEYVFNYDDDDEIDDDKDKQRKRKKTSSSEKKINMEDLGLPLSFTRSRKR